MSERGLTLWCHGCGVVIRATGDQPCVDWFVSGFLTKHNETCVPRAEKSETTEG